MIKGYFGFNCCQEHQQKVDEILAKWKINYVVETGTFCGYTTAFFAERVKQVFTVELTPAKWIAHGTAQKILEGYENIDMYEGNSPEFLPVIFKEIPTTEPVLFYLDAHGYEYWPLLDELDIIAEHIGPRALIIIDDIKVPGDKGYGYDSYGGVDNSLELIEPNVKKIYPQGFQYEYFNGPLEFQLVLDETILNPLELEIYSRDLKGKIMKKTGRIFIYAK